MPLQFSSQFRRTGQRDDRRRRLFADEHCGTGSPTASGFWPGAAAARKSAHYGDAAFMDEQPRLIDLVPRRLGAFALLFLAGLAVAAGLELLYAWMPRLASMTTDGRVAAFDLDSEGSLAAWFSSLTLLAAGLTALLVYSVRRHHTDDYQGRYRIWLWAAMAWFLMATDESASLHEGFKELMVLATGTRLLGDGSIWWAAPYFFLLGAVGSRLLLDMRECRLSSAALLATAGCYAAAVAAQLGWIFHDAGARGVMFEEGAEMLGNLLLLSAMGLHARHVILDAEGLLPRREPKPAPADESEDEEQALGAGGDEWVKIDSAHGTPQPVLKRAAAAATVSATTPAPVKRKLTKQEKKALRERLLRQRRLREQGDWH